MSRARTRAPARAAVVGLVDVHVLVGDELGQRLGDAVEERLGALLGQHVVEHAGEPPVRLDERLRACGGVLRLGTRVR